MNIVKKYNYLLTLFSCFLVPISLFNVYGFSGAGAGNPIDPFEITTCTQLQEMDNNLSASYELVNPINCSGFDYGDGFGFKPIGNCTGGCFSNNDENVFNGTLEGNNYYISNIFINRSSLDAVGLIAYLENSEIQNLNIENMLVYGDQHIGSLAGISYYSSISNLYVSNITLNGTTDIGGLVGIFGLGNLDNSQTSEINIIGTQYLGGAIGFSGWQGNISSLNSQGTISGTSNIGGLIGHLGDGNLTNSYSEINISASSDNIGGLIGYSFQALISNSYSTSIINSTTFSPDRIGGLIGYTELSTLDKVSSNVVINSTGDFLGGLIGYSLTSSISNSYAIGEIFSGFPNYISGGLIGNFESSTLNNSYSNVNVSGDDRVGGLIGYSSSTSIISNSYALGNIDCDCSENLQGGLVGMIFSTTINNSFWYNSSGNSNRSIGQGSGDITPITTLSYFFDYNNPPFDSWNSSVWDFSGNTPRLILNPSPLVSSTNVASLFPFGYLAFSLIVLLSFFVI